MLFDGSKDLKLNILVAFTNGSVKLFDNADMSSLTDKDNLFSFCILDETHKKSLRYVFPFSSINYYELTYTEKE